MCEGPAKRGNSKHSKAWIAAEQGMGSPKKALGGKYKWSSPAFLSWRPARLLRIVRAHPLLVLLALGFVAVIPVEHTIAMVAPGGEPYDAGFVFTESLHQLLKEKPGLNHVLAAANTVRLSTSPHFHQTFPWSTHLQTLFHSQCTIPA